MSNKKTATSKQRQANSDKQKILPITGLFMVIVTQWL